MPVVPPGGPGSSSGPISYDPVRIHRAGQQIVVNAGVSYDFMTPDWKLNIVPYLEQTPLEKGGRPLELVMSLHKARIQGAYDWQLALGNTLKRIAEAIDQNEMIIKGGFTKS